MSNALRIKDQESEQFIGYLKYYGPAVDEGKIDIEKIGTSLISLNKIFKKYSKRNNFKDISLKLGKVQRNCTEVNIFFEQIIPVAQPVAETAAILLAAKTIGITELGKQFFRTIGQQIALKLFSKGKSVKQKRIIIRDGKIFVLLQNSEREEGVFLKDIYDSKDDFSVSLKDLIQLEKAKEEKMQIGYYQNSLARKIAEIGLAQKDYFQAEEDLSLEERLEEDFDETRAENMRIMGKFIDYYGLAHKYHFSFQARKNQEEIGKQKILCKIENNIKISEIIDLLKPENQEKNICIIGKATKNSEDKVDKIKIEAISDDEYFDPKQAKLI